MEKNVKKNILLNTSELTVKRSEKLLLRIFRMLFVTLMLGITGLPFVQNISNPEMRFELIDWLPPVLMMGSVSAIVILVDILTPKKKLSIVVGVYFGLLAGLLASVAITEVIDIIVKSWKLSSVLTPYIQLIKSGIGLTMIYLCVSIVLTTKDTLRLVVPYVEFKREYHGPRPFLIDTSALIDGRLPRLLSSGCIESKLIIPECVIDELQSLNDSTNASKRSKGKRGLDTLIQIQSQYQELIELKHFSHKGPVDNQLIEIAQQEEYRIMSTDEALRRVAAVQGIPIVSIHEMSDALRPKTLLGEEITVQIERAGENRGQGIGHLPDGTMVVMENAKDRIGEMLTGSVTNLHQTSSGQILFADSLEHPSNEDAIQNKKRNSTGRNPRRNK